MKIGSDHIFVYNAFLAGLSVIAISGQDFSQRFVVSDGGTSSMVLKPYNGHIKKIALHHNISDKTAFSLLCAHIHQFQSLDHSLIGLIVVSKELISTTDCDDNTIIFHIGLEILLDLFQLFAYQHLLTVRTTSEKNDIQFGKVDLISQFKRNGFCLNASPETAFHKALDISSVTVKVQKIRI